MRLTVRCSFLRHPSKLAGRPAPAKVHLLAPILWVEDRPDECLLLRKVFVSRPADAHRPSWKRILVSL
eukprot:5768370-Prymnesium_polylepis.1